MIYEAEEHNLEKQVGRKGARSIGLETVASSYLNVKKKRFKNEKKRIEGLFSLEFESSICAISHRKNF